LGKFQLKINNGIVGYYGFKPITDVLKEWSMSQSFPIPLHPDEIKDGLKTKRIGREVIVYSSTSSTNDVAWEYAKNRDNDGLAVFAEEQTAGRGRGGNEWLSPKGQSVLCSVVLLDSELAGELLILSCAVAVAEAIGRCGRYEAKIKWPNDIILNGKKVGGILLESRAGKKGSDYIVGVGINCHQKKEFFTGELQGIATSIDLEGPKVCDRTILAKRLLISLDDWLVVADKSQQKVIERWEHLSTQLGHRVNLMYNNRKFSGNCIGVDPQKGLIVQLERGGVRMFDAAHTSVVRQS
jgi:BirA family biotin operon repressor/biotin-[acetyl-CoA-carboxylase] ligase